jgi:hypothetical protein
MLYLFPGLCLRGSRPYDTPLVQARILPVLPRDLSGHRCTVLDASWSVLLRPVAILDRQKVGPGSVRAGRHAADCLIVRRISAQLLVWRDSSGFGS